MDGSGLVERYGHYHSDFDNSSLPNARKDSDYGYRSEPRPVPSPDGKKDHLCQQLAQSGGGDGWIQDYAIDAG